MPDTIKPYVKHGLVLSDSGKNRTGECVCCGSEDAFGVLEETGQWRCFSCNESGNIYTWLTHLHQMSVKQTPLSQLKALADDRGLKPGTLRKWGVCRSVLGDWWLIPAYNKEGNLGNLHRYNPGWTRKVLSTPGLKMHPFGTKLLPKNRTVTWGVEGPWDAMALWEMLQRSQKNGVGYVPVTNPKKSLAGTEGVIGAPGAETFQAGWGITSREPTPG